MGISLAAQTAYFLWSLVLGLVLGVLYDALRAARMITGAGKKCVMVSDILFFTVCGVLTSLFALPFNKGSVRGFILFGEAAGFLAYRLTLGSVMGKVYAFSAHHIRGFVQKIRKILEKIFIYLLKAIATVVYNVGVVIDGLHRKTAKKKQSRAAARDRRRRRYKEKQYGRKKHKKKKKYRKAGYRGKAE